MAELQTSESGNFPFSWPRRRGVCHEMRVIFFDFSAIEGAFRVGNREQVALLLGRTVVVS